MQIFYSTAVTRYIDTKPYDYCEIIFGINAILSILKVPLHTKGDLIDISPIDIYRHYMEFLPSIPHNILY